MCDKIVFKDPIVQVLPHLFLSNSIDNNHKKCLIVLQNIRSIRSNFDKFLTELSACSVLPQFIFLTEVWIFENELENYAIDNYKIFGNCNSNYKSGGVIAYCHRDFDCKVSYASFKSADIISLETKIGAKFLCLYVFIVCMHTVSIILSLLIIFLFK